MCLIFLFLKSKIGVFVRSVFGHFYPFVEGYKNKRSQVETNFANKLGKNKNQKKKRLLSFLFYTFQNKHIKSFKDEIKSNLSNDQKSPNLDDIDKMLHLAQTNEDIDLAVKSLRTWVFKEVS